MSTKSSNSPRSRPASPVPWHPLAPGPDEAAAQPQQTPDQPAADPAAPGGHDARRRADRARADHLRRQLLETSATEATGTAATPPLEQAPGESSRRMASTPQQARGEWQLEADAARNALRASKGKGPADEIEALPFEVPAVTLSPDGASSSNAISLADAGRRVAALDQRLPGSPEHTAIDMRALMARVAPEDRLFVAALVDLMDPPEDDDGAARDGDLAAWQAANRPQVSDAMRRASRQFHDQLMGIASGGITTGMQAGLSRAAGAAARAGAALQGWAHLVQDNSTFQSTLGQISASVANVSARNVLAVLGPTVGRLFIAHGVEKAFEAMGFSEEVKASIGLAVSLAPVAAQVAGAVRDHAYGTATAVSQRSRFIMGLGTAAAAFASAATGTIAQNASNLLGVSIYTALRDVAVQSRLRLVNRNTEDQPPTRGHWFGISLGYGLDQMLVSMGMTAWATPAGSGAASEPARRAATSIAHAELRGVINFLGEVAEDLMFQSYPAVASLGNGREPHALNLSTPDVGYQHANVVNGLLGGWTVRTGIISMAINSLAVLEKCMHRQRADMSGMAKNILDSGIVGLINGALYHPFAMAQSGQPSAEDLQAVANARAQRGQAREAAAAARAQARQAAAAQRQGPPAGGEAAVVPPRPAVPDAARGELRRRAGPAARPPAEVEMTEPSQWPVQPS